MQLYSKWQQSGVGKMREKPWNVHVLERSCDVFKKPSEVPLLFSQEHLTHSVFQKPTEIVYLGPVLLGDIKLLLSAAEKNLKVGEKPILIVSMAVVWGEDFKMTGVSCLQVSENSHSAKCEWTHMSIWKWWYLLERAAHKHSLILWWIKNSKGIMCYSNVWNSKWEPTNNWF